MDRNAPGAVLESPDIDGVIHATRAEAVAAAHLGLPLAVYLTLGEDVHARSVLTPLNRAAPPLPARRATCDLVVLQACLRVEGGSGFLAFPDQASGA